ncbi:MAG: UTP--glucose-1-phosphate uridylyltransferase GalU [Actinobacteria bacterium]|nr:UTP--glucose-1-phosphate uridylyltransferase GalU [Actinomycetota bacterium]MBI3688499.1 UTP--glucose-1-phosphate uridylyltransferase GalU [Actinomycetota bacterium]
MAQATVRAPRKAVIPAAGLGTRFLPATKAVPKELLPVVDTPAMQYIVEEAVSAGLDEILVITGRGKDAIADHFDRSPELEAALEQKGDLGRLAAVRRSGELASMHFVRQGNPLGLGHAVLCAAPYVGDETFAVMLGDDLIDSRDPLLATMLKVQSDQGGSVVALLEVPPDQIALYGAVASTPVSEELVRITDLVEKPDPAEAPSNLAIIGRYLLAPSIFDALRETPPGRGGEIQLTDALRALARSGEPVHGVVFRGRRYDTGDRLDYLRAVVRLACERADLGADFRAWLTEFVAGRS